MGPLGVAVEVLGVAVGAVEVVVASMELSSESPAVTVRGQ